ncbi:MAG: efflux RND transporter periplasmic adaptor subunit [Gammaproteobacteria bacterium]|nr:MAG: efflux RND transporter periplasmic adaptor subunit [Gammaproteobacteria bacterium]
MMKNIVWSLVVVAVIGGLAYPKLKPLWLSDSKTQSATADSKGSGKPSDAAKKDDAATKKDDKKSAGGNSGKPAAPLKVSTFMVTPSLFSETITATGTVLADEGIELQPETNGKVVSINFIEGAPVKQGDLLLKLNDSDLRANLDRYNYSKKLAEVRFRRYSQLLNQKMVSQDDYDSVLSEMNVQQSYIDLYKAEIQKTEIRAPFNGVVGLRYVSVGAFVNASTRIATLQRLDELKIDFAVPEKYSGRIKVGSQITFTVAGGLQKYAGRIAALDPRIDSGTRTLLVRAICANSDGRLLPGAFTNVSIPLDQIDNAFLVPAEAVVAGLDEKNVYVIKDGLAERRAVETGARTATQVHIVSGLQAGDQVITSGLQQMRAKQPVESLLDSHTIKPESKGDKEKGVGADHGAPKSGSTSLLKNAEFFKRDELFKKTALAALSVTASTESHTSSTGLVSL